MPFTLSTRESTCSSPLYCVFAIGQSFSILTPVCKQSWKLLSFAVFTVYYIKLASFYVLCHRAVIGKQQIDRLPPLSHRTRHGFSIGVSSAWDETIKKKPLRRLQPFDSTSLITLKLWRGDRVTVVAKNGKMLSLSHIYVYGNSISKRLCATSCQHGVIGICRVQGGEDLCLYQENQCVGNMNIPSGIL